MLQDPSLLEDRVTLRQVKAGSVVASEGDQVGSLRPPLHFLSDWLPFSPYNLHVIPVRDRT